MPDEDITVCTLDGREYKLLSFSVWSDTSGNDSFNLEILAADFPMNCKTLMSDSLKHRLISELSIIAIDVFPVKTVNKGKFDKYMDHLIIHGYIKSY